jgi:hypothetical protein
MRKAILGWTSVCVVGWFVVAIVLERQGSGSGCDPSEPLCLGDSGWGALIFIGTAFIALWVWMIGLVPLWFGVQAVRRRRTAKESPSRSRDGRA